MKITQLALYSGLKNNWVKFIKQTSNLKREEGRDSVKEIGGKEGESVCVCVCVCVCVRV